MSEDHHRQRHRFEAFELAMVLSRYDIGVIQNIREYPRGSRRSPKVLLTASKGDFLLKRRSPGRDDPYRVAFAHGLQLHLMSRGFPVPALVGTRDENNSMTQLGPRIYELFRYIHGSSYDRSPAATRAAGEAMGLLHRLLEDHRPEYESPVGSFHAAPGLEARLVQVPAAVTTAEPDIPQSAMLPIVAEMREAYAEASRKVDDAGFRGWPRILIHGDWHPGNLIFRDAKVVAVLDFDSARAEPRLADLANGALQFAMRITDPMDPDAWPDELDLPRLRNFVGGYHGAVPQALTPAELAAMPWMIVQALVVESVLPIATTGSFARIKGSSFLNMVIRKIRWIRQHLQRAGSLLEE